MGEEEFAQVGQAKPVIQESNAQGTSEEWLEAFDFKELQRGQVVEGVVVHVGENEVLVDVGSKSEGVLYERELERLGAEGAAKLKVGQSVLVYVLTPEDKNGNIALSLSRAQAERDWRKAEILEKSGEIFEGEVAGFNKGGLIVRMGKVRGFVPASQIVSQSRDIESSEMVGKKLRFKVIEIDRTRNRLILSERAAMREWRKQQKEELLSDLQEGDVRDGEVISLCDFGAFVDLGGADGLIHLSEISWRRVAHPSEVLSVGDKVQVYVLNIDRERKRIGLSLKRLQDDPWTVIARQYQEGQLVEGTITKLVKFGVFARLSEDDIEGLIHISELSNEHIAHPKEVVKEGDVVTLRVIRIDPERRRIGLSMKRVDSAEYLNQDWQEEILEQDESEDEALDFEDESCNLDDQNEIV
ncbi:MAG: 30S ribosomal protein S1 [Anaerolineae bacterium]|nr:30S ribosomal protein S1 [Anaerolineae bacterium]